MKTRDETKDRLTSITQNYDSDGAQSSKDPHKFDALVELEDRIDRKIDELYQVKNEIFDAIEQLQDSRERIALRVYYIDMKSWEQVAVELNYSWRSTMYIRKQAISHIEEIIALFCT